MIYDPLRYGIWTCYRTKGIVCIMPRKTERGILGYKKDPKNQVLFSFNPRDGDECPTSDSEDSDYLPSDEERPSSSNRYWSDITCFRLMVNGGVASGLKHCLVTQMFLSSRQYNFSLSLSSYRNGKWIDSMNNILHNKKWHITQKKMSCLGIAVRNTVLWAGLDELVPTS